MILKIKEYLVLKDRQFLELEVTNDYDVRVVRIKDNREFSLGELCTFEGVDISAMMYIREFCEDKIHVGIRSMVFDVDSKTFDSSTSIVEINALD